ncbi:hypothetical protein PoB_003628900 [Plakobranchus ocellatus]|uniref:Uncharacterized protein n=1 Tax=Plakobranchus ocellatus TaxID=259542 RepID=A0AAV4APQ3_9GAST|nr:hypothetical protein PoB_003628900 [Plakobranchus ocellatus]
MVLKRAARCSPGTRTLSTLEVNGKLKSAKRQRKQNQGKLYLHIKRKQATKACWNCARSLPFLESIMLRMPTSHAEIHRKMMDQNLQLMALSRSRQYK